MRSIKNCMPDGVLKTLATIGHTSGFKAGKSLFHEGEVSDSLYVLLEGQIKIYSCDTNGREVVYNVLNPGEVIGEMILDGGPRSASAKTVTDSRCLVVKGGAFQTTLRAQPEFAEALVLLLIARLRAATRKIRSFALDGVYERVVALLEEEAVPEGDVHSIPRVLTQLEIANRVGASREMVNHVLRDLVRGGFIRKDSQHRMTILRKLPRHW